MNENPSEEATVTLDTLQVGQCGTFRFDEGGGIVSKNPPYFQVVIYDGDQISVTDKSKDDVTIEIGKGNPKTISAETARRIRVVLDAGPYPSE